ncbi:sialidase [Pistacia vera]|uniref:sialidase n=1 Tax=Pistacia vera TaxID=55513 RepID=UPI001263949A|nr:sialidase [Pistacia vera]
MMNRSRNIPAAEGMQLRSHRRGQSLTGGLSKDVSDENQLDLFSKTRRTLSVASSDDSSDVSVKLGRLSVGSAKLARSGIDDLLSSTEGGKHDYDWLLTPPGTPLLPSSDGSEFQTNPVAPRSSSLARSVSTTKASRLSVSQSESNHTARPARSSSVTRSSVSSSQYSTYSSNRGPSILNTSSASVSSYTRPASPSTRSASRPSTPSSRPTASRSSTPSRTRPSLTSSSVDRTRPTQNSRPSTPSSRPQIPANLNSTASRSNSRPSTPTRRNPVSSIIPAVGPSNSAGRVMSNGRTSGPASRPSSPSPRVRPPQQPVVPPDFPLDTPPNLRTTLPPDRPVSAGRSRPGSVTVKGNPEATGSVNMPRRHSSPIVSRGRLTDPPGRSRTPANGHTDIPESRRTSHISELSMRKPVKPSSTVPESTGFGRTISKKSLDMAIRHMDIRNGSGSIRQLSGTTLFPQSIRSATSKTHSARALESVNINGGLQNRGIWERGNSISRTSENGNDANDGRYSAKLSEVDIYESSRYDALLLKEDLKNTNWLHSIDDKSEQGLIFDNGFDPLPEPFGLL